MTERVAEHEVWPLWRRFKQLFPTWSLLPESFYTPGAWTLVGTDFVSGFRRNRSTRRAFELLNDRPDAEFEGLVAVAALNARRQDLMLRAVLVAYITVPLSLLATGAEIAPDDVERLIREHLRTSIILFSGSTVGTLFYVCGWWRSRQMMSVLDLIRIERGMLPSTSLELRDGG